MLNVKGALATRRHWKEIQSQQVSNAQPVDRAARLAEMTRIRPDAGKLLAAIDRTGFAVVPNYWSAEECARGRAELDRLIVDHPEAVRRFSGDADKRMFGVEAVSEELARFHDDPFLIGMGEAHGGLELYAFATLGARIDATAANNGSGDGWHRDGFGFQFKSILYLSDTTDDNGPFEYLPGSHSRWRATMDTALGDLPAAPNSRMAPEEVERLVRRTFAARRRFVAPQGTLILANTAGIHRGAPLRAGTRYALTNYFYHPYQVCGPILEKFSPMMPGARGQVEAWLAERSARAGHA